MGKFTFAAAVSAFIFAGAANAATVVVVNEPDPNAPVASIDEFTVYGDSMADRLRVTATFAGGFSETLTWAAGIPNVGGVSGTNFSLRLPGDTFTATWTLTNLSDSLLTSLLLEGDSAATGEKVIFDKTLPSLGTEGSRSGRTFEEAPSLGVDGNGDGTVTVTYLNAVTLPGDPPVGDVFANLLVDFSEFADGGVAGRFLFRQDTDIAPVPLPAAGLMLFGALAGMGMLGRRKARAA